MWSLPSASDDVEKTIDWEKTAPKQVEIPLLFLLTDNGGRDFFSIDGRGMKKLVTAFGPRIWSGRIAKDMTFGTWWWQRRWWWSNCGNGNSCNWGKGNDGEDEAEENSMFLVSCYSFDHWGKNSQRSCFLQDSLLFIILHWLKLWFLYLHTPQGANWFSISPTFRDEKLFFFCVLLGNLLREGDIVYDVYMWIPCMRCTRDSVYMWMAISMYKSIMKNTFSCWRFFFLFDCSLLYIWNQFWMQAIEV